MLRMTFQSGIVDGLHGRVAFESFSQSHSIFVVLTNAERERSKSPKHKPGIKRPQGSAEDHVRIPYLRDPPKYFVALWNARSIPMSSGR